MVIATTDGNSAWRWTNTVIEGAHIPPAIARSHILFAGLGNVLMGDDGVGVHVTRRIAENLPVGAVAVEIGTAVLDALPWLGWADAVIAVDAISAHGRPGTVYRIDDAAETIDAKRSTSLHNLGILQAMLMLPKENRPQRFVMIGVQPDTIRCSRSLSPAVEASIPAALLATRVGMDHCVMDLRRICGLIQGQEADGDIISGDADVKTGL